MRLLHFAPGAKVMNGTSLQTDIVFVPSSEKNLKWILAAFHDAPTPRHLVARKAPYSVKSHFHAVSYNSKQTGVWGLIRREREDKTKVLFIGDFPTNNGYDHQRLEWKLFSRTSLKQNVQSNSSSR